MDEFVHESIVPFLGRLLADTERGFAAMNESLKTRVETSLTQSPVE